MGSGDDCPIFVPNLDGERTPNLPTATGSLTGLTSSTTRESLARSIVDGIALGLYDGYQVMERLGVKTEGPIQVTGGAPGSKALVSSLADFFDREIAIADVDQAVCRGVAVQAAAILEGASVQDVRDRWRPTVKTFACPRNRAGRAEAIERYRVAAGWRGMDRK